MEDCISRNLGSSGSECGLVLSRSCLELAVSRASTQVQRFLVCIPSMEIHLLSGAGGLLCLGGKQQKVT